MSFKIHLVIVFFIILVIGSVWKFSPPAPPTENVVLPSTETSNFSISVINASWGQNCQGGHENSNKILENNVLSKISALCNAQVKCNVPVETTSLGEDPLPECRNKVLSVEYRCFSYDRPWKVEASYGILSIDCNKTMKKAADGK